MWQFAEERKFQKRIVLRRHMNFFLCGPYTARTYTNECMTNKARSPLQSDRKCELVHFATKLNSQKHKLVIEFYRRYIEHCFLRENKFLSYFRSFYFDISALVSLRLVINFFLLTDFWIQRTTRLIYSLIGIC